MEFTNDLSQTDLNSILFPRQEPLTPESCWVVETGSIPMPSSERADMKRFSLQNSRATSCSGLVTGQKVTELPA